MALLEGVMQTPEEVAVMRQRLERGWSQRRIARELGISCHTVSRYLALGTWQPYDSSNRAGLLDGCKAWLQQQFEQHHGKAEVVRQELLKQNGIRVSLRTVERSVQDRREALRQSRQATVRYETRPGQQLQADFGELWVLIGGVRTKVHLCVLTLGYSRRLVVRVPLGLCLHSRGPAALSDRAHPLLQTPAGRQLVAPPEGAARAGTRPRRFKPSLPGGAGSTALDRGRRHRPAQLAVCLWRRHSHREP